MLIEGTGDAPSALDHLGVEVGDAAEVAAATARLAGEGLATDAQQGTTCCYALQDKVWVTGPGAERWEVYTVLADAQPELEGQTTAAEGCDTSDGCCAPTPTVHAIAKPGRQPEPTSSCC